MTNKQIRHLPVILDGQLHGIVSMGDLVKARIGELEADRAYLQSYICAGETDAGDRRCSYDHGPRVAGRVLTSTSHTGEPQRGSAVRATFCQPH